MRRYRYRVPRRRSRRVFARTAAGGRTRRLRRSVRRGGIRF